MSLLLNIGSGQRPFDPPWINIDRLSREGQDVDLVCDGVHIPYDEGVAEMVVLHHVLEHQHCGGEGLVEEAFRLLKPGGKLLVFVPDMRTLAQAWLMGKIDDQLYFTNVYGAYMGSPEDEHKWGYTPLSLLKLLKKLPWHDVEFFDWRPIEGAKIAKDWWVCGVEATK